MGIKDSKAKILVVGGGGIGAMVAYALETGGRAEVSIVLRSNFKSVRHHGYCIDSIEYGHDIVEWRPSKVLNAVPNMRSVPATEAFEYIVVTTKNIPDVPPTVADIIEPAVTPGHSVIVLIQNGINIEKDVQQRFPSNTVLSSVQLMGAAETSPGRILHNEPDVSMVGVFENASPDSSDLSTAQARKFVELYNACGKVKCLFDPHVEYTRWKKLVYNSSYNAVAAILRMNVTEMRLCDHVIDDLIKPTMEEIVRIARAAGHQLPDSVVMDSITADRLESWCMPSMGQDVVKGNLIEVETIIGEPIRIAQSLQIPCPTLTSIYGILKGIQAKTKLERGLLKISVQDAGRYSGKKVQNLDAARL